MGHFLEKGTKKSQIEVPRGGHHGGGRWPIVMPTAPPPDLADSPRPDGALLKGDEPKYERMGSSESGSWRVFLLDN